MKLLIIVPSYPTKTSSGYQFVHDRVKEYIKEIEVNVFCLDKRFKNNYVFEGINVYGGNTEEFEKFLNNNKYDAFAYFFLTSSSARFIIRHMTQEKVFIFFMGSDCVSCKRRFLKLNNISFKKRIKDILRKTVLVSLEYLKIINIKRINNNVKKCTFVFVSNWSKINSEKDFNIKYNNYEIIHNYINSNVFKYKKKKEEDRFKVLSIKSYSTMVYGGDILQDIILKFSKYKEFKYFTFNIYGFGSLFNEQTKLLKKFKNVNINEGVLKHNEIVKIQNVNGIMLYPKRGDSQGVSRCEAMLCGLVPIASDVEAISEFTPSNAGFLAKNVDEFIDHLIYIYNNPKDYLEKSLEASNFIKEKCSYKNTIEKEMNLFKGVKNE